MVKEAVKQLKHRKNSAEVYDFTSTACDKNRYFIYDYPPPEMYDGCIAFIQNWEEEVEKVLLNRENNDEVESKLCYEISKACKGVENTEPPQMPDYIEVDGQKHAVGEDGTATIQNQEDL